MTSHPREIAGTGPLGQVTVLGAHILDVLGRPVEAIPPGQGSARLTEIRATAAGTAAGTGVDLAKLGADVLAVGAIGDDLLGDMVAAAMARHGVDTSGLARKTGVQTSATILPIRPNGERPALHVPGRDAAARARRRRPGPGARQPRAAHRRARRARRHRRRRAGAGGRGGPGRRGAGRRGRAASRQPAGPRADRRAARRGGLVPARTATSCSRSPAATTCPRPSRTCWRSAPAAWPSPAARTAAWSPGAAAARRWRCPPSRSTWWTPPAAATASPRACSPGCCSAPRRSTPRGSASPAARWSPPASGRTPGSRASARRWTSSAARSRPWPAGSPPRSGGPADEGADP